MEPVTGRRVRPLRASLSEFFGTPTVQGTPIHIIHGTSYRVFNDLAHGVLTTVPVAQVVQGVQQVAQAERQAEERMINEFRNYARDVGQQFQARDQMLAARYGPYQEFAFRNDPAFRRLPFARGPYQGG